MREGRIAVGSEARRRPRRLARDAGGVRTVPTHVEFLHVPHVRALLFPFLLPGDGIEEEGDLKNRYVFVISLI